MQGTWDTAAEFRKHWKPELITWALWWVPRFPIDKLTRLTDKDPATQPWLMKLYEDIKAEGKLRNPVIVWNHQGAQTTGHTSAYRAQSGRNRVWCAKQLGWSWVPCVVSTPALKDIPLSVNGEAHPMSVEHVINFFPDNDVRMWSCPDQWGIHVRLSGEDMYNGTYEGAVLPASHEYD